MRAYGSSMLPAIQPGDELVFAPVAAEGLRLGQIVLLRQRDALRVHRIVAIGADAIVTQGDSLRHRDGAIALHDVLGVLVAQSRAGRALPPPHGPARWRTRLARWLLRHLPGARRVAVRFPRLSDLLR
ncbi:S24/S26 family peptidase [Thermomonas flagellata]|uniref:S24/S26 family peptidase n=1 Tax=Thermomonas flagellata TaxID=2888524 RepID=UPI001F032F3E|nr:S24/S26 family peptidase [Thermomonas flagellata]